MFRIKNVRNSTVAKQSNIPNPNPITTIKNLVTTAGPDKVKIEINKASEVSKLRPLSRRLIKKNENIKLKGS
jgi:hypothetical protein